MCVMLAYLRVSVNRGRMKGGGEVGLESVESRGGELLGDIIGLVDIQRRTLSVK